MSAQRDWPARETVELALQSIRRDGETQSRSRLNQEVIREYADLLLDGIELPPIRLCFDGESFWLTDGFHRVAAAERAGKATITCSVFKGTLADAQ